jgi:hypothetical protein
MKNLTSYPPPWNLKGEGFIFLYKFSKSFIQAEALLPTTQVANYSGGLGYVMLVNYEESPVGPYKELLIIPGKFGTERRQAITKIYVDSEASTQNGRENWGIPKETLPIIWQKEGKLTKIGVGQEHDPIWYCEIKTGNFPIPVSTKLLPIELLQTWEDKQFLTKPTGRGWGKLANLQKIHVNPEGFPNIIAEKPLLCVHVHPFEMYFPIPRKL